MCLSEMFYNLPLAKVISNSNFIEKWKNSEIVGLKTKENKKTL